MKVCTFSIAILVSAALFQGCVTQMDSQASSVRVINDIKEYNCEFKGIVTGSASMGWTTAHDAEGAFNEVINNAAKKGANAIVITDSDSSTFQTTAVASAYLCAFE